MLHVKKINYFFIFIIQLPTSDILLLVLVKAGYGISGFLLLMFEMVYIMGEWFHPLQPLQYSRNKNHFKTADDFNFKVNL